MRQKFDMAIIGAGPGGYVAAIRAAQLGSRVALVEEAQLGGTCLNRGCIPTKALLHTAEVMHTLASAGEFGVVMEGSFHLDLGRALKHKEKVVSQLRRGVEHLMAANGVEVIPGRGRLAGTGKVAVTAPGGELVVEADKIVIATGSRPAALPVPGAGEAAVIDSDAALAMAAVPESVLIIGGGAVGIEFANIYHAFGAQVTLVEMLPRLAPGEDEEISALLAQELRGRGITVHTGAKASLFKRDSGGKTVATLSTSQGDVQVIADVVLAAAGRRPNTEGLGLETVGVATGRGWITTDDYQRTNVPGIYAVGDVTGRTLLAHAASMGGVVAVEHAAGQHTVPLDPSRVPRCIFNRTEIASIGLTEAQAREQGHRVATGKFPFSANGRAITMGPTGGMVKVVAAEDTGELLGVHIIGPQASSLIMEAGVAMTLESTLEELTSVVHPHPTLTEAMEEVFLAALGRPVHIPRGRSVKA
ncbi:MAG: dihydrolipoyl dehydrogenase [Firmicutes bacterium]|nr:dihydrolipoyl dehydrogenase [Bacillota bacterium]